jgi:hypothetical protein
MILHLDGIMESKRKCKSDNEAKKSCKVMTLDEKIKILDTLRGGTSIAAVGLIGIDILLVKSNTADFSFHFYLHFTFYVSDKYN